MRPRQGAGGALAQMLLDGGLQRLLDASSAAGFEFSPTYGTIR